MPSGYFIESFMDNPPELFDEALKNRCERNNNEGMICFNFTITKKE